MTSPVYPLSLTGYHGDRHEALHSVGDLVEGLYEVPYEEGFVETSALFVSLPVALTSGVLVVVGLISGCIGRQLVC
jgi:hypothetical protein